MFINASKNITEKALSVPRYIRYGGVKFDNHINFREVAPVATESGEHTVDVKDAQAQKGICGYSDTPLTVTFKFGPEGVTVSGDPCMPISKYFDPSRCLSLQPFVTIL